MTEVLAAYADARLPADAIDAGGVGGRGSPPDVGLCVATLEALAAAPQRPSAFDARLGMLVEDLLAEREKLTLGRLANAITAAGRLGRVERTSLELYQVGWPLLSHIVGFQWAS